MAKAKHCGRGYKVKEEGSRIEKEIKGYRIYDQKSKQLELSRSAKFDGKPHSNVEDIRHEDSL